MHRPLVTRVTLILAFLTLPHYGCFSPLGGMPATAADGSHGRLRLVIETDAGGDPDDEQSLVRLLLYANEWDIEGIIANRSRARERENLNPERTGLGIVRRLLGAYAVCYPNLVQHDSRYPKPDVLLKRTVAGYEGMDDAVKLIIAAVDRPDPRPLWYSDWGSDHGSAPNNLKRALDRVLRDRGQAGYARFKSRMRLSSYDAFGEHTSKLAPPFQLWVDTFRPEQQRKRWYHCFSELTATAGGFSLKRDVLTGHGALGALYPTNTTHVQKEGDTMTFLYLVPTGMNDPEQPTWGSWAGRYGPNPTFPDRPYYWADQSDTWQGTTHRDNTLRRWAADLQNDFRARLDWCVKPPREANHPPAAVLNGRDGKAILHLTAAPGATVELSAAGSHDPDGQTLSFEWFVYPEAGTYRGAVTLADAATPRARLQLPADAAGKTIHVILAVRDQGEPALASYRRAVVSCVEVPPAQSDSGIRAGAAKVEVTPPLPAPYDLLQVAKEIAHPLYARVVYLEDSNDRVVLVATDYEGILRSAHDTIRSAVAEAANVPLQCVVVGSNHSHNAAWLNLDVEDLLTPHGLRQVDKKYFRDAVARIAAAARQARERKQPATVWAGSTILPELACNRRIGYVKPADVERMNRKRRYPIGITDPTLGLVRVNRLDGKAIATLSFYASHYVAAGPGQISSSYPGPAMACIEEELGGGCVSLFFQGCAGNVVPPPDMLGGSKESVEKAGGFFAGRALPILKLGMRRIDSGDFGFACRRVKLPLAPLREHGSMDFIRSMFAKPALNAAASYRALTLPELEEEFRKALKLYQDCLRKPDDGGRYSSVLNLTAYGDRLTLARNLDRWSQYDLQGLRVGPLCLAFLPGEPFVELALEIRERSGSEFTFVSGYTDATPVYVPDETAFEEGGYEVGPWCYSTPETGTVLVHETLALLKSLKPS